MPLRLKFNKHLRNGLLIGLALGGVAGHAVYTKEKEVAHKYRESADRWVEAQDKAVRDPAKAAAWNSWCASLDDLKGKTLIEQLSEVNARANALIIYTPDPDQYGDSDYWASGAESVYHKKGDCEDYAILKYESLRYLGVSDDACAVVLMDTKDAAGKPSGHAMVMVDASSERGYLCFYMLDVGEKINELSTLDRKEFQPTRVINRSTSHPFPR